jgi:hypothetical protein
VHQLGAEDAEPGQVWLPLLATYGAGGAPLLLAAPLDVAWVWHLHRLQPDAYVDDCMAAFGFVVPHTGDDPFAVAAEEAQSHSQHTVEGDPAVARAQAAWAALAPHEPFHLPAANAAEPHPLTMPPAASHAAVSLSCDLAGTAGRQGAFLWQVLDGVYEKAEFLRQAEHRYVSPFSTPTDCGVLRLPARTRLTVATVRACPAGAVDGAVESASQTTGAHV